MKDRILQESFYADGRSGIAMWSDPRTIYSRRDGSYYITHEGKRITIERRPDGTFYLASHE